jgi:hypothetical protein
LLLVGRELSDAGNGIALRVDVGLEGFGSKTARASKQFIDGSLRVRGESGR